MLARWLLVIDIKHARFFGRNPPLSGAASGTEASHAVLAVSAELTNQPTPAIFHRQWCRTAAGPGAVA